MLQVGGGHLGCLHSYDFLALCRRDMPYSALDIFFIYLLRSACAYSLSSVKCLGGYLGHNLINFAPEVRLN